MVWFRTQIEGRIVDAAGYAKVGLVFDQIDLFYNQVKVLNKGNLLKAIKLNEGNRIEKKFEITIDLNLGMEMLRSGQMI